LVHQAGEGFGGAGGQGAGDGEDEDVGGGERAEVGVDVGRDGQAGGFVREN